MSSNSITITAQLREITGTNKVRNLRKNEMVPAVIYGNEAEVQKVNIPLNELLKASQNDLFYTQILLIAIDGKEEKVVLKELQREPQKGKLLHADFMRVSRKTILKVTVPINFINEENCLGVKTEGGVVIKTAREIEVSCSAENIPESIEIDIENLNLNESLRLSDIVLPEGAEIPGLTEETDQLVVSVNPPKAVIEDDPMDDVDDESESESETSEATSDSSEQSDESSDVSEES
ncbi:MAG: 50S ribosomal protein L25/general stress protein Ctc [Pseudomonadota bacterium]|jgi:large subunit ribosomal protein L25|nr:50S ribosomal protein L25/general stress protein Ctc [Pseudomonadota bacterium]|tara:strand:+ start:1018 stop:1722 length:705 start_codon:yes stop_codon:yes gene_type:complete